MKVPDDSSELSFPLRQRLLLPIVVVLFVLVVCGLTMRGFGLTTDEAIYIKNNEHLQQWFADFGNVGFAANFSDERLREGWHYGSDDSKNLPLVTVVSSLSRLLTGGFEERVASYRWGNIFVFAVTCAVVFDWIRSLYSTSAGLVAVTALVGTPRLLANTCLISIDPLVGCFWVLATWALSQARNNWKWSIAFAILAGIGATTKTTFWFAFPVWVLWGCLYRPLELKRAVIALCTVCPVTVLLFVPTWWANPLAGLRDYVAVLMPSGNGWPIDAYYLGEVYQYSDDYMALPPLPWHAVPVLSLITTPVWITLLALVGLVSSLRVWRSRETEVLWLLSAVALPIAVMLPFTPAHDGVRLFRASFFFVALLVGAGFHRLSASYLAAKSNDPNQSDSKPSVFGSRREAAATSVIILWALGVLFWIHPAELSYYNLLVGGWEGATERIPLSANSTVRRRPLFEMSYWWEYFDEQALLEMQKEMPEGSRLWIFPENLAFSFGQYREWGLLRPDITTTGPSEADFVLIYGRLGRITLPQSDPLGEMFFTGDPIWEREIHGRRVVALYKWR